MDNVKDPKARIWYIQKTKENGWSYNNVGGVDFYIDLLFYNLNLRDYVVIDLETEEFKPESTGQLNF